MPQFLEREVVPRGKDGKYGYHVYVPISLLGDEVGIDVGDDVIVKVVRQSGTTAHVSMEKKYANMKVKVYHRSS